MLKLDTHIARNTHKTKGPQRSPEKKLTKWEKVKIEKLNLHE